MTLDPLERRRPLNFLEACQTARSLWGEAGACEFRPDEPVDRRYVVGTKGAEPGKSVIGRGATWEEAFEDAEKRRLQ